MGSKGSMPSAPDYASIIPVQERSNINQFNTMLGASRVNSNTPYGRQYWTPPPGWGQPQTTTGQPTPAQEGTKTAQGAPIYPNATFGGGMGNYSDSMVGSNSPAPQGQAPVQGQSQQGFQPTYEGSAGQGPWTFNQELSPEQQKLYNQDIGIRGQMGDIAQGMMGPMADMYGKPADFASQLPGYQNQQYNQQMYQTAPGYQQQQWRGPQYNTNVNSRDVAEKAIYDRQMRYLSPDYAGREKQLNDRLLAQGFNINDPGYKSSMDSFQAQRDRAMADARDQAILGGGTEATQELQRGLMTEDPRFRAAQSEGQYGYGQALNDYQRQYGLNQAERQFGFGAGMQNQQAALNYALQQMGQQRLDRATPLNELSAFRTGNQVTLPGTPGQTSVPNLQGVDFMGAAQNNYANQMGQYNAGQASSNNFMNGLFGIGGAALGAPGGSFGASALSKLFGI